MKKFILLSILALVLCGCGETVNHPIAGKTFYNYYSNRKTGGIVKYYHFQANGACSLTYCVTTPSNVYEHFKWKPDGNTIVIRYDNSFYWKAEVRGKIKDELIYNPRENSLTSTYTEDIYYKSAL